MRRLLIAGALAACVACVPDSDRNTRQIGGFGGGGGGRVGDTPDAGPATADDAGPAPDAIEIFDDAGNPIDIGFPPPPDDAGTPVDTGPGTPADTGVEVPVDAGVSTGPESLDPLGPAPGGMFEHIANLDIRNDTATPRIGETAFSGIPIARDRDMRTTEGLVVVGPGDQWLQAQFDVTARWGGRVDDTSLPIRWLQVSVQASVDPNASSVYQLRQYNQATPPADPLAAMITSQGNTHTVNTGVGTFVLDATNPALFSQIDIDPGNGTPVTVYRHVTGAGPHLSIGNTDVTSSNAMVDAFEIVERGPVKVVVALEGYLVDPGGATMCRSGGRRYEAMGYTIVATFHRNRRDVDLELNFRNECSEAFDGPWTDDTVTVSQWSWEMPLDLAGSIERYFGGGNAPTRTPATAVEVEQQKGGGGPWRRRARVLLDGADDQTAEVFDAPIVAVAGDDVTVSLMQAWMRFREPMSVSVDGTTLSMRVVSESLRVGEARGIWSMGRVSFSPRALVPNAASLTAVRDRDRVALERGLMISTPKGYFNGTNILPSLGTDASSPVKTAYVAAMESLHEDTIGPQWRDSKTYGSQLWPDIQFDQWGNSNGNPNQNSGRLNYWNPSGAEQLEFLRTGDPKWIWDFSMPQSWLQMHSAYCNLGKHTHGNRNGFALTSGGSGEGNWHRSSQGSDDYTYNMGLHLAYALRPTYPMRRRFGQAGQNFLLRYNVPANREGDREQFVNEVQVSRQFVQHLELLSNCAEFVPGQQGQSCDQRLSEILTEMANDNFAAGVICEDDARAVNNCSLDQQFMQNSLHLPYFHRIYRNYGDVGGVLKDALVGSGLYLYAYGMAKQGQIQGLQDGLSLAQILALPSRPGINAGGGWAARMECSLQDNGARVRRCANARDQGIDPDMFDHNKPHSAAVVLMAHELEPTARLCGVVKTAFATNAVLRGWDDLIVEGVGWTKGTAQMMQSAIWGVGVYDTCTD